MKKFIFYVGLVLALALLTINISHIRPANAGQETVNVYEDRTLIKSVVFVIGLNEYFINNNTSGVKMDAKPFIQNGRTFVPVRYLGNALGVTDNNITWDGGQKKVTLRLGSNSVEMVIGLARITTGGQARDIDVAPILNEKEGRTYLPARYIAEGLGFEVAWDEATQTVLCWPKGTTRPEVSAVQQHVKELVGKPEVVRELEGVLGVTTKPNGSYWWYEPTRNETFQNKDRSYFALRYNTENGLIGADISWATILPDKRNVELDLSPIEKVLNWRFPDQSDKVKEIMAYAWQVAERTRADAGNRLPWKDYYLEGQKVSVGSVGFNFVGVIISRD